MEMASVRFHWCSETWWVTVFCFHLVFFAFAVAESEISMFLQALDWPLQSLADVFSSTHTGKQFGRLLVVCFVGVDFCLMHPYVAFLEPNLPSCFDPLASQCLML